MLNIPVVLIVYNRPDLTARVLRPIAEVQPRILYVISDGPKDIPGDGLKVQATRDAVEAAVTWPCELRVRYAPRNLGIAHNWPSGMRWVFDHPDTDAVIMIEDDVLAEPSYLRFADAMLARYADDDRVGIIGGARAHHPPRIMPGEPAYEFTHSLWHQAVAFWRRTWDRYEDRCQSWVMSDAPRRIIAKRYTGAEHAGYVAAVERALRDPDNEGWDYKLSYAWTAAGQWAIQTRHNCVSNIGFRADGVHCRDPRHPNASLPTYPLPELIVSPGEPPAKVTPDV